MILGEKHHQEYLVNILIVLSFAALYGFLEYYWIAPTRDVPFRYGHEPLILGFYMYHIFPMLFIFALVGLSSFIDDWLGTSAKIEKRYTGVLAIASTLFAVMFEDIAWFVCRLVNPLAGDPLARMWIQSSDWTARWTYLPIPGGVIPGWYFVVACIAIVLWAEAFWHLADRLRRRKP